MRKTICFDNEFNCKSRHSASLEVIPWCETSLIKLIEQTKSAAKNKFHKINHTVSFISARFQNTLNLRTIAQLNYNFELSSVLKFYLGINTSVQLYHFIPALSLLVGPRDLNEHDDFCCCCCCCCCCSWMFRWREVSQVYSILKLKC